MWSHVFDNIQKLLLSTAKTNVQDVLKQKQSGLTQHLFRLRPSAASNKLILTSPCSCQLIGTQISYRCVYILYKSKQQTRLKTNIFRVNTFLQKQSRFRVLPFFEPFRNQNISHI